MNFGERDRGGRNVNLLCVSFYVSMGTPKVDKIYEYFLESWIFGWLVKRDKLKNMKSLKGKVQWAREIFWGQSLSCADHMTLW